MMNKKDQPKEVKISDQYYLYIIREYENLRFVELHDFYNLCCFRGEVNIEESEDMVRYPEKYI